MKTTTSFKKNSVKGQGKGYLKKEAGSWDRTREPSDETSDALTTELIQRIKDNLT